MAIEVPNFYFYQINLQKMKKLFLTLLLLLNVFCVLAQQQTTECICLQKAFGLDTVKVYADCSNDKKHACDQFTKIELLKNNGEKYIVN